MEYQKEYFTQTGINVTIGDLLVHEKVIRPRDRVAILLTQNRIKDAPTILQFGLKPGATILGTSNAIEVKQGQLSDLKQ